MSIRGFASFFAVASAVAASPLAAQTSEPEPAPPQDYSFPPPRPLAIPAQPSEPAPSPPGETRPAELRDPARFGRMMGAAVQADATTAKLEGAVGFRLTVGTNGRVSKCVVTASSGQAELDLLTCRAAERYARFHPALDSRGNPAIGYYSNRLVLTQPEPLAETGRPQPSDIGRTVRQIMINYPSQALRAEQEGTVGISLGVSANGRVHSCEVISSSGHSVLDEAACRGMQRYGRFEPARDAQGNAVEGTYTTAVTYSLGN